MADRIAGQDIAGAGREGTEIDDLCPAHQEEDPSNQPPAEMREKPSRTKHDGASVSADRLVGGPAFSPITEEKGQTTGCTDFADDRNEKD